MSLNLNQETERAVNLVGNHELKLLLLGGMDNTPFSPSSGRHLLRDLQGLRVEWQPGVRAIEAYFDISLVPSGFVERGGDSRYRKTGRGEDFGESFAGAMLRFSNDRPWTSLGRIFGKADSGLRRLQIFEVLTSTQSGVSSGDLAREIGMEGSTLGPKHLKRLALGGIINYQAKEADAPVREYELLAERPQTEPSACREMPTFTQAVYALLQERDGVFNIPDIKSELIRAGFSDSVVIDNTSNVLAHLAAEGYINKLDPYEGEDKSIASLSDFQRRELIELTTQIGMLSMGDDQVLSQGRRDLQDILTNPEVVSPLVRKVRALSPYARNIPVNDLLSMVTDIVKANHGTKNSEILGVLAGETGTVYSPSRIDQILKELASKEDIGLVDSKTADYWG